MQWNQPFRSYGFQSYPKPVSPAIPQIVGEGDVTAVTFSDGSVQFYFVPIIRQDRLPCPCNVKNPCGSLFPCLPNTEVWCVRSIANPQPNVNISVPPGNYNLQLPNTFGECPPYSPPNYYTNPPTYHEYTQKFHNDIWTSTTDIHYFYPSLRRAKNLQYCTETQTDITLPLQNQTLGHNGQWNRPCHCGHSLDIKEQKQVNIKRDCCTNVQIKSSNSCMSIDSEGESGRRRNKKYKKKSMKNKKTSKTDHICECNETKGTANKLVTTFADQATENVAKDGRETQTDRIRKPLKQTSKTKPIIRLRSSSENCSFCGECLTCSTSETELGD